MEKVDINGNISDNSIVESISGVDIFPEKFSGFELKFLWIDPGNFKILLEM